MYGYLSRTPSVLTGVSLADAVGDRRTQNIPGTSTEYPNWQVPLCDASGAAVLLEDLGESALLRDTVAAARRRLAAAVPAARAVPACGRPPLAAQRAGHVVASFREQPGQRGRRPLLLDVGRGGRPSPAG